MDETSLRDLLDRATVPEPPIGPGAQNALRAGLRLRRRRRGQYAASAAAAVAVACAAVVSVTTARGGPAAVGLGSGTVYVLSPGHSQNQGIVIPIPAATGKPGNPIVVRAGASDSAPAPSMVVTPDGKTIWVADGGDAVTPISTATNTAGKPITVVPAHQHATEQPEGSQVLVSPNGKTVYVLDSTGTVTPISTATDQPGTPIRLGLAEGLGGGQPYPLAGEMAITPDGKTLYVRLASLKPPKTYVVPIATATNTPGAPIWHDNAFSLLDLLVAPDARAVYVVGAVDDSSLQPIFVMPVSTTTGRAGRTITFAKRDTPILSVMSPDGHRIYVEVAATINGSPGQGVIPFSTVTDTPGPLMSMASGGSGLQGMAVSRDGRTLYALTEPLADQPTTPLPGPSNLYPYSASPASSGGAFKCPDGKGVVTPISTATNTPRASINVGCPVNVMAISPDGSTVWVGVPGAVIPISTATGQRRAPITIGESDPTAILVAP